MAGGLLAVLCAMAATVAGAGSTVTAQPASGVTATSAMLSGSFTPNSLLAAHPGEEVTYRFEYGTTRSYGSKTPDGNAGNGGSPVTVQATITGLKPGTTYNWRLSASTEIETAASVNHTFTTTGGSSGSSNGRPPEMVLGPGFSRVRVPAPKGKESSLDSIACPSASECIGVGGSLRGFRGQTLAERWRNGRWRLVSTPDPRNSDLVGVSCPSAHLCLAVGTYEKPSPESAALAEKWNGHSWRLLRPPSPPQGGLTGVDCVSSHDCWAAGFKNGGSSRETALFERWNGHSWSVHPLPGSRLDFFESVSCSSASDCWASGFNGANRVHQPWVAAHWNGKRWSKASVPSSGPFQGVLSVSCHKTSECWAIGGESQGKPVAMRLEGGKWQKTPVELPPLATTLIGLKAGGELDGLACTSPSNCWAVGRVTLGNAADLALAERWDGNSWKVVPSGYPIPIHPPHLPPGPKYEQTSLHGVACPSPHMCLAVGATAFVKRSGPKIAGRPLAEAADLSKAQP